MHQATLSRQAPTPAYGGASDRAWLTVILLSFLYAASFVDRMILALLMDPIGADLGISDTQLSMLFGLGFSVAYVLAGLPLGHLADHGNRRRILIAGVVVWSAATAAGGFADGFATLAIARAGVGIGEAVLTPVAISMIADLFAADRRALPTSIYSTVGAVMASGALIVGGGAVWLAGHLAPLMQVAGWRLSFVIVAVPGVLGAILFAVLIPEPKRREAAQGEPLHASTRAAAAYLLRHARLYLGFFLGVGAMLTQAMGLVAWGPTMLAREYDLSIAQAGAAFGIAAVLGSLAGTLSVPFLLRLLPPMEPLRGIVVLAMGYALVTAPLSALGFASGHPALVIAAIGAALSGLSASAVLPSLLVQAAAPGRLRARAMAVYLLVSNLISLGLGPVLVTLVVRHDPARGLSGALTITSLGVLAVAMAAYAVALGGARRATEEAMT